MNRCKNCGEEFESRLVGKINEKKFCCFRCRTRYNMRDRRNPTNNKASKINYENNKIKWHSRMITKQLENNKKIKINKKCNHCGSIKDLQIHHEIYPTKIEEIKKALNNGKIYYLCRSCHGKEGRKTINRKITDLNYKNELKTD